MTGLEYLPSGKAFRAPASAYWIALGAGLGVIAGALSFASSGKGAFRQHMEQTAAARDIWLRDCKADIAVCAIQWDQSATLRDIYRERVKP